MGLQVRRVCGHYDPKRAVWNVVADAVQVEAAPLAPWSAWVWFSRSRLSDTVNAYMIRWGQRPTGRVQVRAHVADH